MMEVLYALDKEGDINKTFVQAPKFVLRKDGNHSQIIENDLESPGAEKVLAVCKKLDVETVVAGDFGADVKKLFQEAGIKMREVDTKIDESIGKEDLKIETIPQRIGRPFKILEEHRV